MISRKGKLKYMAAIKGITVTKESGNSFKVQFPVAVNGPGDNKNGDQVPVEWLRAALDYYVQHRDASGALSTAAHNKVKALW
jgi:hypothetical protein